MPPCGVLLEQRLKPARLSLQFRPGLRHSINLPAAFEVHNVTRATKIPSITSGRRRHHDHIINTSEKLRPVRAKDGRP